VYAQLILENAQIYEISDETLDQIFDFMVRDFSKYALQLLSKANTTTQQSKFCTQMIRKPVFNQERFNQVWDEVFNLKDLYEMNP
jgi:acyl-CoA dehydrogenase